MRRIAVTDRDNGREVRLEVGDELTVRLDASPGAGYSWQLVGEEDMLKPVGEPSFQSSGELTMGGGQSNSYLIFELKLLARGQFGLNIAGHGNSSVRLKENFPFT